MRRPVYGGVLRVGLTDPLLTTDPVHATTFSDWLAVGAIHAGLYRLGADGRPRPDLLSERPQRLEGGRAWRCTLRRGLRFHGGRVLRAADVRASLERHTGHHAWIRRFLTVTVVDDWSFVLRSVRALTEPQLGLLLSSPALSVAAGPHGLHGLGPFRAGGWQPEAGAVDLAAYGRYHGGRPYLDRVQMRVFERDAGAVEGFHYGKVDLVFVDSPRYTAAARLPGPVRETVGVLVRDRPATRSADVRRAVSAAAPRALIGQRVAGNTAPAVRLLPDITAPPIPIGSGSLSEERWFIGADRSLEAVVKTLAAALGPAGRPWPTQGLDRFTFGRAMQSLPSAPGQGRWDALLVSWLHTDPLPEAALRTVATWGGVEPGQLAAALPWIPLVDRGRIAVYRDQRVRGLQWRGTGLMVFADAWRLE